MFELSRESGVFEINLGRFLLGSNGTRSVLFQNNSFNRSNFEIKGSIFFPHSSRTLNRSIVLPVKASKVVLSRSTSDWRDR